MPCCACPPRPRAGTDARQRRPPTSGAPLRRPAAGCPRHAGVGSGDGAGTSGAGRADARPGGPDPARPAAIDTDHAAPGSAGPAGAIGFSADDARCAACDCGAPGAVSCSGTPCSGTPGGGACGSAVASRDSGGSSAPSATCTFTCTCCCCCTCSSCCACAGGTGRSAAIGDRRRTSAVARGGAARGLSGADRPRDGHRPRSCQCAGTAARHR